MRYTIYLSFVIISLSGILSAAHAQERVHPGVMYQPGDTIYSPIYGIQAQVPEGWYGVLPQDTELFLLTSQKDGDTRILVRASENSVANIQEGWQEGLALTDNLKVVVTDSIKRRGDIMYADVDIVGANPENYQAYVEARCGAYGKCVGFFLTSRDKNFNQFKQQLSALVDNTVLKEPGESTRYANFDWLTFLSGKYLATINQRNYKRRREINEVHLQADGDFRSRIEQRGLVDREKGEYWGNNKGTWQVEGSGKEATLVLNFKKHDPLRVNLVIDQDQIFLNGQRFFVMYDK